jgi:hypothetical protein
MDWGDHKKEMKSRNKREIRKQMGGGGGGIKGFNFVKNAQGCGNFKMGNVMINQQ